MIFDLGGVVLGSPLEAIARYERELGLPGGLVARVVVETGEAGAWSRLERGELPLEAFYGAFERECAEQGGSALSAREMMLRVHAATEPRPRMLEAVRRIRERGLRTAALTNNWIGDGSGARALGPVFDLVVESSVVGLRKPDPRIYTHTCQALGVAPPEAVFLDDIGRNLKAARQLGMRTIKVEHPDAALRELEALLGFGL